MSVGILVLIGVFALQTHLLTFDVISFLFLRKYLSSTVSDESELIQLGIPTLVEKNITLIAFPHVLLFLTSMPEPHARPMPTPRFPP